MPRRRTVVMISAAAVLFLGLVLVGVVVLGTRTDTGRELIRRYALSELSRTVRGKVYLGRLRGSIFGDITLDSIEIRESNDSLFFASGPISVRFRPGDIIDRRVRLALASAQRPHVHVRQDSTGIWNYRKIFPAGPPRTPRTTTRGFGDYIVLDSLRLNGASFAVTMPWTPDDTLRGTKRDSAVTYNLTRTDREVRRAGSGFVRTFRWTDAMLIAGYTRVAHPDSAGQFFTFHRLDVTEQVPPFKFSKIRGTARLAGDSVMATVTHFELPGSKASGSGKVSWGDGETRYDLRILGQQVALADINWVYPTLPTTGGGSVRLHITNARNPDVIDYVLTDMDVRAGSSRLRGDMTFAVGGPVLEVRDLDLDADPVNFALLEGLSGEKFPYPWRGDVYGNVTGRGGPLNNFVVQDAKVEFRDTNVPGAVTRGSARGTLNIVEPGFTVFRGFDVQLEQLDLRTLQFLDPEFPRLNGSISGAARLDSVWLDVRFSNADLTHRDGDSPPSRFRGNGRVTIGAETLVYDLALTADSLSFTTLARSYPSIRLRGQYAGPMRIHGTLADLSITTTLRGAGGTLGVDGMLDGSPPGYGFSGVVDLANVDLRTLLDTVSVPTTSLTGRLTADVRGDSALASLTGSAQIDLERGHADSLRIFPSRAQLRFSDGRARVDTLILESAAGRLEASGGLGLTRTRQDSLSFVLSADSLGALRRYVTRGDTVAVAARDSLLGTLDARGMLVGSVDTFTVAARLEGRTLRAFGQRARAIRGTLTLDGLPKDPRGVADVAIDTAVLGGVSLVGADVHAALQTGGTTDLALSLESMTGPTARAVLHRTTLGDTTHVAIDSLALRIDDNTWSLQRAAQLVLRGGDVSLTPLALIGGGGQLGRIAVQGTMSKTLPMDMRLTIDSVALDDLGKLAQTHLSLGGRLSLIADVKGTRPAPLIDISGRLVGAAFGEFRIARGDLSGSYRDRNLTAKLSLYRDQALVLSADANLPIDLAFEGRADRTLDLPLSGTIRSSDVDLALLESFTPQLQRASGRFNANLDLGGSWDAPRFTGAVNVRDGAFSWARLGAVRIRDVQADIQFLGDSVHVNRLVAVSGQERADSAWMRGWVEFSDRENPRFDIDVFANNFAAIANRRTAELTLSGQVGLQGALRGSSLSGRVLVNEGVVYIPELVQKEVISLDDPSVAALIDTTIFTNRSLLPRAPPTLVRNLTIQNVTIALGDNVWLRSREANIKLEGSLDVTTGTLLGTATPQLSLVGTLETTRGSYVLDLAGVVRRLFDVESGTLRFFGEPDFNPTLNIRAVHTVAVLGAADLSHEARIRVILEGTLARPALRLESADARARYSQSDLLSLLVTGAPSLQQGATGYNAYLSSLFDVFASRPGDWVRRALALDLFAIRGGAAAGTFGERPELGNVFLGATLAAGKQVGERSFLTLSYGLCPIVRQATTLGLAETLELRFEHRLQRGFGVSLSREPGTLASCGATGARTFTATPAQYGLDLFRSWRY
ncbi:MAG: translocation/assembly module TamB domain-containing protein [Gemmatimonadaceae bacterium]